VPVLESNRENAFIRTHLREAEGSGEEEKQINKKDLIRKEKRRNK